MLDNKTYDILKEIALLWFPVAMALVTGVMGLLDNPYTSTVAGILALIDTALGSIVTYYKKKYDAENEE